jgi:hypothetical protein
MSYVGMCTFIVFCSGPSAGVADDDNGQQVAGFSLNAGTDQTQVFDTGPGLYQVIVTAGSDTARWSVHVQDFY